MSFRVIRDMDTNKEIVHQLVPLAERFLRDTDAGDPMELRSSFHSTATGVTRPLFEQTYLLLSGMRCWKPGQLAEPWKTRVIYGLRPQDIESSSTLQPPPLDSTITVVAEGSDCDTATLVMEHTVQHKCLASAVQETDAPPVYVDVDLIRTVPGKRYLKENTKYNSITVERYKEFVFTSHYTWRYSLVLRYEYPYVTEKDSIDETVEPDLFFVDSPKYYVWVSCSSVESVRDPNYMIHSLLLKLGDLVPTPLRLANEKHLASQPSYTGKL